MVIAQPSSPPFFEEISAHIIFLLIFMFAFAFFHFHMLVDFRVPPAYPLGQIGSILDRFWCDIVFNFPVLSDARAELLQRSSKELRKKLAENLQRTSRNLQEQLAKKMPN